MAQWRGLGGRGVDVSRIQKELRDIQADTQLWGVRVELPGNELSRMRGEIGGPQGTPYEGGTFALSITFPAEYPFEPPKISFITKVWHPNVSSQNGTICLDILKDQWSPALTLKTALLSVQALLASPQPDDPQDAVVAEQFLKDRATFDATAKYWTETFAKKTSLQEKVARLVDMGFPAEDATAALERTGGDETAALEKLCG